MEYIYILKNSEVPTAAKCGMTTQSPRERCAQINGGTGQIGMWSVYKSFKVSNCRVAERKLHRSLLRETKLIPGPNKEIFRIAPEDAAVIAEAMLGIKGRRQSGFTYYLGRFIINTTKALVVVTGLLILLAKLNT